MKTASQPSLNWEDIAHGGCKDNAFTTLIGEYAGMADMSTLPLYLLLIVDLLSLGQAARPFWSSGSLVRGSMLEWEYVVVYMAL
jgi:hypothetical protein